METPEAGQNIITRGLPKTGQVIQYQIGDNGTYQAGWWKGRLNATNKTRWIAKTIGGDDIVLDRATGLMWAADGNAAGCNNGAAITWANAITYATGPIMRLTFATFSDWRVPNVKELMSIVNYNINSPSIDEPPFANTASVSYWSSTTDISDPTKAWHVDFNRGIVSRDIKTEGVMYVLRCVRKGI